MTNEKYDSFLKAWEDSQTWEQGAEGPSATDRGSFKAGYFRGREDAEKALPGVDDRAAGVRFAINYLMDKSGNYCSCIGTSTSDDMWCIKHAMTMSADEIERYAKREGILK